VDDLRANGVSFEDWGVRGKTETTVRFVTSWATTEKEVEELIEQLK
jgi:threonine aldolase